jgi:flagellin-specific chaperone FliS
MHRTEIMPTTAQTQVARYYSKMQIETASKRKAIYLLHERCMSFLLKALKLPDKKAYYCAKAQNILSQLQTALNVTDSTSRGIFHLYDYCYVSIDHGSPLDLENAMHIMTTFTRAFRRLMRRP